MKFTERRFQLWCDAHDIEPQDRLKLLEVIKSNPIRKVGGGRLNVTSSYISHKMGVTIQSESRTLERAAILACYESNPSCIAYFDQPVELFLKYQLKSGRNHAIYRVPDFLSFEANGLYLDEWKYEDELKVLSEKQPNMWMFEDGKWRCPPAEIAATEQYGAKFRVRSEKEIDYNLYNNMDFMADYYGEDCPEVPVEVAETILKIVSENLGITLADLLVDDRFESDHIFTMIAKNQIYIDLSKGRITQPENLYVFISPEVGSAYDNLYTIPEDSVNVEEISLEPGSRFILDGKLLILSVMGDKLVYFQSEEDPNGSPVELGKSVFFNWLSSGKLRGQKKENIENYKDPEAIRISKQASTADQEEARRRWIALVAWQSGQSLPEIAELYGRTISESSLYNWQRGYRVAEQKWGIGFLGLIPLRANKGNRLSKLPPNVLQKLLDFIEKKYETFTEPSIYSIWALYKKSCEDAGQRAASYTTFCNHVNNRDTEDQTRKRKGFRAASNVRLPFYYLNLDTPKHGERAMQCVHIDHTELDIELLHSVTGKSLGKPHLTLAVDAKTRRVVAMYLTFDQPSYRSLMVILADIVRRTGRLPQSVMVDWGPEFRSVDFEILAAKYNVEIFRRPKAEPKTGNPVERLFGTTNTAFIYQLIGNTQAAKRIRQMTKSNNPKNLAIWNINWLYVAICEFLFETYNNSQHPALEESPNEAFDRNLLIWGQREFKRVKDFSRFKDDALPRVKGKEGLRTVESRGVLINYVWFKPVGKYSKWIGKDVEVRYDPFDFSRVKAYIGNEWVECRAELSAIFKNVSWKVIEDLCESLRLSEQTESKRQTARNRYKINAKKIAEQLEKIYEVEAALEEHVKSAESRLTREATLDEKLTDAKIAQALLRLQLSDEDIDPDSETDEDNLNIKNDAGKPNVKPLQSNRYDFEPPKEI